MQGIIYKCMLYWWK